MSKILTLVLTTFFILTFPASLQAVDFNKDVRPLLASKCYACHGPDEEGRKAKLRLDIREDALGNEVIVPGVVEDSEFHYRIRSDDPDEIMPPPESHASLTEAEKDLLDQWIAEGAEYAKHWAFEPPQASITLVNAAKWGNNSIDAFILKNLEKNKVDPSPQADRYTLVRRLYLDLTGLPPTPEQADDFVNDHRVDAYEHLVDQLLASPHYGEKWAREWLDLARYADTNGYEKDRPREIWQYRDWVIRAINEDMPYDQFTIEQLAGDMLPGSTQDQKIATGFHRNTQLNEEGGIDPLEFRFYAAVDRVATTGTVWMGLTTGCAQCHTHKYDPITHDEYFGIMALLDNVEEPDLLLYTDGQLKRQAEVENQIQRKIAELTGRHPEFDSSFASWRKNMQAKSTAWKTLQPTGWKTNLPKLELLEDGSLFASGDFTKRDVYDLNFTSPEPITALRIEALPDDRLPEKGPGRAYYEGRKGLYFLSEVNASAQDQPVSFKDLSQSGGNGVEKIIDGDGSSGWSGAVGVEQHLVLPLDQPLAANQPFSLSLLFERHFVASLGKFRISATSSTQPAKAQRLGSATEDLLSKGNQLSQSEISQLRATYLEKAFLPQKNNGKSFAVGAKWIWDNSNNNGKETLYFAKSISLKDAPKSVRLLYTCDDESEFFINGKKVASNKLWYEPALANVGTHFKKGTNVIAVKATNNGGPGALLVQLEITKADGKKHTVFTDESWEFSQQKPTSDEWKNKGLADGIKAILVGKAGDAPWNNIPLKSNDLSELNALRGQIPQSRRSLVMQERPSDNPRPTYLRHRGEYTNPKHEVAPGIPDILLGVDTPEPGNRLEFARWLVSQDNPLGDRVTVNRAWRSLFGYGLIRTSGDFGTQAPAPDHPELLDWLAVEFRKLGMSMKKLHRLIVTSSTYKQSSVATPELLEKDPQNRLLARGPRIRLTGELIRDHMLTASGKLSSKMYGRGVYPPQPKTVLSHAFGNQAWNVSTGEDRYRRSLYTFIKRTAPFAGYMTFDGTSGENCLAKRDRSNTPLQALTLLNDEMFIELAQAAGELVHQKKEDPVESLFRRFLTRMPKAEERKALQGYFHQQVERLQAGELKAGDIAGNPKADPQWAGKVLLARAIMNLDETITKP
ncbi:DUF1549 domain-containing protein [Opitutales bacterium]|nr:DUF1549 domain-containing protein [Opitutales bacterium]